MIRLGEKLTRKGGTGLTRKAFRMKLHKDI
jgi:hypothetical protein